MVNVLKPSELTLVSIGTHHRHVDVTRTHLAHKIVNVVSALFCVLLLAVSVQHLEIQKAMLKYFGCSAKIIIHVAELVYSSPVTDIRN